MLLISKYLCVLDIISPFNYVLCDVGSRIDNGESFVAPLFVSCPHHFLFPLFERGILMNDWMTYSRLKPNLFKVIKIYLYPLLYFCGQLLSLNNIVSNLSFFGPPWYYDFCSKFYNLSCAIPLLDQVR